MRTDKKGFTLLELLIVMGIIVILTGVLVTVLNPVELLRRARDTRRLNDLATLHRALGLYVTDISSPQLDGTSGTVNDKCNGGTAANKTLWLSTGSTGFSTTTITTGSYMQLAPTTATQAVAGTGWVPVNFGAVSAGSPISILPIDPTNASSTVSLYYSYACDKNTLTWELNAQMEASVNKTGAAQDKEGTDGGDIATVYEVGSYAGLSLLPTATSTGYYPNN